MTGFPKGILVPVRDAPGTLPDLQSCWDAVVAAAAVSRHLEIQVDTGWGTQFFMWFWVPYKRHGNGDRGSTQNFDTNLVSIVVWPGEPF